MNLKSASYVLVLDVLGITKNKHKCFLIMSEDRSWVQYVKSEAYVCWFPETVALVLLRSSAGSVGRLPGKMVLSRR